MIYTDGACSGNPGPGGWACVLLYMDNRLELSGGAEQTTNNRMELFAAISGLQQLKEPCQVTLYSDSAYLVKAFNEGWLPKWQRSGWLRSGNQPVKNRDLWEELLRLSHLHTISWVWVKGHSDSTENNRCDHLARNEIARRH